MAESVRLSCMFHNQWNFSVLYKITPITFFYFSLRLLAYNNILISFLTWFLPVMHIFMAIGSEMFYFHRIASLFKTGSLGDVSGHTKANWVQWTLTWKTEERQGYIRYLLFPFYCSHSQIAPVSFSGI